MQAPARNTIGAQITAFYAVGFIVLGWYSLVLNYLRTSNAEARRRIRVIPLGHLDRLGTDHCEDCR